MLFLFLINQLPISSSEKNTLEKKSANYAAPPLFKFLVTSLPSMVVGEKNLVIGLASPLHIRNASAIAD